MGSPVKRGGILTTFTLHSTHQSFNVGEVTLSHKTMLYTNVSVVGGDNITE